MPVSPDVKAGKIVKPYGLQGQVIMILEPGRDIFLQSGSPLFIEIDGQRVPFFLKEVQISVPSQAIIKFEWVDSVEEAKELCGCHTYLDPAETKGAKFPKDERYEMVGYAVVDEGVGALGVIKEFIPHEMNPVWLIDQNGKEILVPATEQFIQGIDRVKMTIRFRLPEGLTEL